MKKAILLVAMLMAVACSRNDCHTALRTDSPIYPDYRNVTIPVNIARLNFCYTDPSLDDAITTFTCDGETVSIKGTAVKWRLKEWRRFLSHAAGKDIEVQSSVSGLGWKMHVSTDSIDYGLNYRLIEPGYEVYSKMGIYERELSSYKEKALIENTQFDGCVNCHSYNRCSPDYMSLHIRGPHGATILRVNGEMDAYNTKTAETLGFCVYPSWHPTGKYIAYSTNNTRQSFHVQKDKLVEVFDNASDLQIYDVENNTLITAPQVKVDTLWETFPSFSADGRTLYFCRAVAKAIPLQTSDIRYNLCKVSFDPETGTIGKNVETVIDAASTGKSISFPKTSFDGRFLMYTLSDYGQFSIWHHEADLYLLDLTAGLSRPLDEVNSKDTESYHSFSSNSRWFVFSSRRDDGLFTRPYIAHLAPDGTVGKPFMLPQKDPRSFYEDRFLSFNVPEFVTEPVRFDRIKAQKLINNQKRTNFKFRWSE